MVYRSESFSVSSLQYLTLADPSNLARPRHLAYYEWGDASNPHVVVCVHGLSRNAHDFDFLAKSLESNYRVLCIDMAGRGKSDWFENKADYNYGIYVADILVLLAKLKVQKVDWIGTSMGGIIGMMLAAQHPDIIKHMVLNDVGSLISAKGLKRILGYVGSSSTFDTQENAMAYIKTILKSFGIASEAEWEFIFSISFNQLPDKRYVLAYDPDISRPFREAASKGGDIADVDLSMVWNMLTCPVLILRGQESDILTEDTALSMCKRNQPTKLIQFENVGHAPALLNDLQIKPIKEWLTT
jgi:pimeloyl-ACP methyl ester carboxylesterase